MRDKGNLPATRQVTTNGRDMGEQKGVLDSRRLPDPAFDELWDSLVMAPGVKDRLLGQSVLNFTARPKLQPLGLPLHGLIGLVGPPGTGKTTLARGLASRTAASVSGLGTFRFIEVEPHALASAALGRSQQAVRHLLSSVIAEQASASPCIVLLDEVETLAASRAKMSLEANPVDVHRATDAVLAQMDQLAASTPDLLFLATSNFAEAVDEAFLSRADLVVTIDRPGRDACREILRDSVERIGQAYPRALRLLQDPGLEEAARICVGMDGRQIRKAMIAALASTKETALDPGGVSIGAIQESIKAAQSQQPRRAEVQR